MKVLILSCNTGEGHNAAGKALKERIIHEGHEAVLIDIMGLVGERTAKIVGGTYVKIAKYTPRLFQTVYWLGDKISSSKRKSPVYYANTLLAEPLKRYLDEHEADIIVTPHLFAAETLTYMKQKGMLKKKTVAIATDYTCIPFWEETNCDYYIVPHRDLCREYVEKGMDKEKLYPLGIPVNMAFSRKQNKQKARKKLGLSADKPVFLIMGGSMGFGKIGLFAVKLNESCRNGEQMVIICGNDRRIYRSLTKQFKKNKDVRVVGFTRHVADYMDACDVIYTKPGGLTSTEALVKNIPIVHTAPIPGCETKNMKFFVLRGMSVSASRIPVQIEKGKMLVGNEKVRNRMLQAQKINSRPNASDEIFRLLLEWSK